jgi:hypothetical protein
MIKLLLLPEVSSFLIHRRLQTNPSLNPSASSNNSSSSSGNLASGGVSGGSAKGGKAKGPGLSGSGEVQAQHGRPSTWPPSATTAGLWRNSTATSSALWPP